jgi:hypothetical protein
MAPDVEGLALRLKGLPLAEIRRHLEGLGEALPLPARFELLHLLGVYHHPESVSGVGSTLRETARLREALPGLVRGEGVRSLLDIPCGDFHWMQHVALDVEDVAYTGADVVPEIVAANQALYGNDRGGGRRRFVVLDATRDALPAVDLILCRDLLIHLSNEDVLAALRSFAASGSRLLLTSHFADRTDNPDIESGDFRPVNLCRAPFHLPAPLRVLSEDSELGDGAFRDRAMALWRLSEIGAALGVTSPGGRED